MIIIIYEFKWLLLFMNLNDYLFFTAFILNDNLNLRAFDL